MKLKKHLNLAQRRAVRALPNSNVLVVAGAGTGKTRLLVWAVVFLVKHLGVDPRCIMVTTFTRRAATEMVERICHLLKDHAARPCGGTFHSFAAQQLRKHGHHVGLGNNWRLIDPEDCVTIMRELIKEADLDLKALPRPRVMLDLFSAAINKQQTLKKVVRAMEPAYLHCVGDLKTLRRAFVAYKRRRHLLDFDDLLTKCVRLLEQRPHLRKRLQRQHRWLLVDEYQDTNGLQARMVDLLASDLGHVLVVGDNDQSIYGWRGADADRLPSFEDDYNDVKVLTLDRNYRSHQPILDVANAVISQNSSRYSKRLHNASRPKGPKPQLLLANGDRHEASEVADLLEDHLEEGLSADQLAVLYRMNHDSAWLELELDQRQIPFVKRGGLRFKERAHVKDVIAYLRVVANPTDELAWWRLLDKCRGVGRATARRVYEQVPYGKSPAGTLRRFKANAKVRGELTKLVQLFEQVAQEQTPGAMLEHVLTFYLKHVAPALPDPRRRDLDRLQEIANTYQSLTAMLTDFVLEPPDSVGGGEGDDEPRVVLSTVHSAKSQEWPVVVVLHAQDDCFPCRNADDIQEERRLLYVAVTRAMDHLYLSCAGALSPFIEPLVRAKLLQVEHC